ncbi:MAG: hypothetical protein RIB47_00720 [Cyclobacteriaceae bacterium]
MKAIFIVLITILAFASHGQSPWVAEKGSGYAQLGFTTIGPYSSLYLSDGGSYNLTREVTDRTVQLYGEYGLGNNTSILSSIPIKMMETGEIKNLVATPNAQGSFTTLGNLQLAARHNFINSKVVFSGQLTAELPTAGYDEATGLRGGLDAFSIIPRLSIGKGLNKFYGYLSSGVAIRTNDYSSDFRLSGEVGYKLIDRVYLILVLDVVENFENGNAVISDNQLQTGLYLNNQSFFAYGFKGSIGFTDNIGITGAYYGASSGNVVAKSPSVNFGVYFKW